MARTASGERWYAVTIQHAVDSIGTSGAPVETWADTTPAVWMGRKAASGKEAASTDTAQREAYAMHTWTLPYLPTMDPDVVNVPKSRRLKYLGGVYDITEARHGERGELLIDTVVKADDPPRT